jgi:hypothetical protein
LPSHNQLLHYRTYKNLPLNPTLSQMNPVHILTSYFFKANLIRPIIIIVVIMGDNIRMDHKVMVRKCVEWTQLAHDGDL